MNIRPATVVLHGPYAEHDMECPVLPGEPAVLNITRGVFEPSWKAQESGWHLVHADTWLKRQAIKILGKRP